MACVDELSCADEPQPCAADGDYQRCTYDVDGALAWADECWKARCDGQPEPVKPRWV